MNTITLKLDCQGKKPIFIGERGENEATEVVLDYSDWVDAYGEGTMQLYVMRPEDTDPYIVVLESSDNVATWLVSNTDTSYAGLGKAEYVYTVDDVVAKTAVFYFGVGYAIDENATDPPDPYTTWLDTLTALSAATQQNAEAAAQSASDAEDAQEAAENAQGAAETAQGLAEDAQEASELAAAGSEANALKSEGFAVGQQNGTDVDSSSPYYHNNSEYYADLAAQSAEEAGYVTFELDENGHLIFTKTVSTDLDFSLNNGHLILEVS